MESKRNIDQLVEETLDSFSAIEKVKTPPFFKDKVLNRMAKKTLVKQEGVRYLDWFKPKYQAAALIVFVILNSVALFYSTADSYGDNVDNFAEVYGLSETDTDSYFYQNQIQ